MKHLLNKGNAVLLVLLCLLAGYVNAADVSCQVNLFKQKLISISQTQITKQLPQAKTENTQDMANDKTEEKPQMDIEEKVVKESKFGGMFELLVPARLRKF